MVLTKLCRTKKKRLEIVLSLPNQPMNKKELIEKIMEKINSRPHPPIEIWLSRIEKILQDTLPEDNEWDVVEKANICWICWQEKWFNKTCDWCQERIA